MDKIAQCRINQGGGQKIKAFDANIDIFAFQETNAYIKTIHDTKKELTRKKFRPPRSEAMQTNKQGGGTLVAATTPLYCIQLIGHTLAAEMEELMESTRLAASWIQTNGIDNGIVVISYYGILSSNADEGKRRTKRRRTKGERGGG